RLGIHGFDATFISPPLEQLFARAFDKGDLDVAELSFSNYVYLTSEKKCNYVALPIFPSRTFRHSAIYVNSNAGIHAERELIVRGLGVRQVARTSALMAGGVREDGVGVKASAIRLRYGHA